MRNSTALAVGLAGMGLTASTTAGWALGIIPPAAWVGLFVFGVLLMVAAVAVWKRGEATSPSDSPLDRLRGMLARGTELRTYVLMEGAGAYETREGDVVGDDPYPITRDEPLYKWAREAWEIVHTDFTEYADEFYGKDSALGPMNFMLGYAAEVERDGRGDYLERRLTLLRRILDRASAGSLSPHKRDRC